MVKHKKTSSQWHSETESQIQMPECVNYSRKWLCLGNSTLSQIPVPVVQVPVQVPVPENCT